MNRLYFSDQLGLAVVTRPVDLRHALAVAEVAGVVERFKRGDLSARERAKGIPLIIDPPLSVRLNNDEPVRTSHVCPEVAPAANFAATERFHAQRNLVRAQPNPLLELVVKRRPRAIRRSRLLDAFGQNIGIPLHRSSEPRRPIARGNIGFVQLGTLADLDNGSGPVDGFGHGQEDAR